MMQKCQIDMFCKPLDRLVGINTAPSLAQFGNHMIRLDSGGLFLDRTFESVSEYIDIHTLFFLLGEDFTALL